MSSTDFKHLINLIGSKVSKQILNRTQCYWYIYKYIYIDKLSCILILLL